MNMDQLHGTNKPSRLPEKKKVDNKQSNVVAQERVNIPHHQESEGEN